MATKMKPKTKQKKKKERSTLDGEAGPAEDFSNMLDSSEKDNLNSPLVEIIKEKEPNAEQINLTSPLVGDIEENNHYAEIEQVVVPSAPIFEEACSNIEQLNIKEEFSERIGIVQNVVLSMPLEEAERLFCGNQIVLVKIINEKESKATEKSICIFSDHPLIDLLSTFKQSLIAVERERKRITQNYIKENIFRTSLWSVEKREAVAKEKCACGLNVQVRVQYDYATLWRDKLPDAKMKLEALSRDLEGSYCHQLHCALLAHYQIEGFICEVLHTTNSKVRVALSLVLETLRKCESAPLVLCEALERWATVLVAGLLRYGHLEDLLFVCHHLYRQNRSVYWAGRVMSMSAGDLVETARVIGLLEVILTANVEPAKECTDDAHSDQVWEEVDRHGSGCAVSNDSLRERDLLMILYALPMRDVIARLALVRHQNINDMNEYEWGDESKGSGVLKAICGSRVFLNALHQGVLAHPHYTKLAENISMLAVECLRALADLHAHSKSNYDSELIRKISSEFEAAFYQAWSILLTTRASVDQLPFDILSFQTARNYLVTLSHYLHDAPTTSGNTNIQTDALNCQMKLRVLSQMAVTRTEDYDLAKSVIHFLIHESFSTKVTKCSKNCEQTARALLSPVLRSHPYLYADAICTFATFRLGEEIERANIEYLSLVNWVPSPQEVMDVLWKVTQKLPVLLPDILMSLDFTPQTGLPLETQLSIASFLCKWTEDKITNSEWRWTVLRRLNIHRSEWGPVGEVPAPEAIPEDLFSKMATLLATSWGHCVPMICEYGVGVLCALSRAGRVRDAIHCLQHVTRVMADAPESIAFTPMFSELCNILTESGPSLVQRALGRGGVSGHSLLLTLLIQQLHTRRRANDNTMSLLAAWLQLCRAHPQLVEVALVCCYDCADLDLNVSLLFQQDDELLKRLSSSTTASTPTLALHTLTTTHASCEVASGSWARLLLELHAQRCRGAKIHVDNAVQLIEASFRSEELVIYRAAGAALGTPVQHPSHLFLWRLFFYLYLQRPPSNMHEDGPPIGPLFFEGLIKSRTLQQLKRKLQDAIIYHTIEYEKQHSPIDNTPKPAEGPSKQTSRSKTPEMNSKIKNIMANKCDIFAPLALMDFTGEEGSSTLESSSDEEENASDGEVSESPRVVVDHALIKSYHRDAAKTFGTYLRWLMDGDKTRTLPHHAELTHYISAQALNAAWKLHLKSITPPSGESNAEPRRSVPDPPKPPALRLKIRLQKIKSRNNRYNCSIVMRPPVMDVPTNPHKLRKSIQDNLDTIKKFSLTRVNESAKLSQLDEGLWRCVAGLYVGRSLYPVRRACANKCRQITMYIPGQEWCLSPQADLELKHNRKEALQSLERLARPKLRLATATAALQTLSSMVQDIDLATNICEMTFNCVNACVNSYPPARDACVALVTELAQRFISKNGLVCAQLIQKWSVDSKIDLCQKMCINLLDSVELPTAHLPVVYRAVLHSRLPPHVVFSLLSKFEIPRWLVSLASPGASDLHPLKGELLHDIVTQLQTYGVHPEERYIVLIELLCIHMISLLDAQKFRGVMVSVAHATSKASLPHMALSKIAKCAQIYGDSVPPEEMTVIFYEIAMVWHENQDTVSSKLKGNPLAYTPYVLPYICAQSALTHALLRALQKNPHNSPSHICQILWSCTVKCWSPWIMSSSKLLPLIDQSREDMRSGFLQIISDIYTMVPGGECVLFQEIFKWVGCLPSPEYEHLLPNLSQLPWRAVQWFHNTCLRTALQLSVTPEARTFLHDVTQGIAATTWLLDVSETDIAPYLALLLSFLTTAHLNEETLKRCISLPWHRLPLMALEPALGRFFEHHYSATVPYYKTPQFVVILGASEMHKYVSPAPETVVPKRMALLSHWLRAVMSPRPEPVYRAEVRAMLTFLTALYGDTDENCKKTQKEIVEMLSLAITVFCTEPAAAAVQNVWLEWVKTSPKVLVQACVRAVVNLTSYQYYTKLADPIIMAYLSFPGSSWEYVRSCWSFCMFEPHSATSAYARATTNHHVSRWITTMTTKDINFVQEEMALALWICLIVRTSLQPEEAIDVSRVADHTNMATDDVTELGRSLLSTWAAEPRLSILKTLTMSKQDDKPTPRLRLLARLAVSIVAPSDAAAELYRAAHACVRPAAATAAWAGAPGRPAGPGRLPRLAIILFPDSENFFKLELDYTSDLCTSTVFNEHLLTS